MWVGRPCGLPACHRAACDIWVRVSPFSCLCSSLLFMFLTLSAGVTLAARWGLCCSRGLRVGGAPAQSEP